MFKSLWEWITGKDFIDLETEPLTVTTSYSGEGGKFSTTISEMAAQKFTYTPKSSVHIANIGDIYRPRKYIIVSDKFIVTGMFHNEIYALWKDGRTQVLNSCDLVTSDYELLSRNQRVIVGVEND